MTVMSRFPERQVCALPPGTLKTIRSLLDLEGTVNSFIRRSIKNEIARLEANKSAPTPKPQVRKATPLVKYTVDGDSYLEDVDEDDGPPEESTSDDIAKAMNSAFNIPAR
jgi:hypothetical protein